jgi:hypothetical protein
VTLHGAAATARAPPLLPSFTLLVAVATATPDDEATAEASLFFDAFDFALPPLSEVEWATPFLVATAFASPPVSNTASAKPLLLAFAIAVFDPSEPALHEVPSFAFFITVEPLETHLSTLPASARALTSTSMTGTASATNILLNVIEICPPRFSAKD